MQHSVKTLIFDVNETLLDLSPLKESIKRTLRNEQAAELWFSQLLHYSLVESITGSYHDFSEIAASILRMNAEKQGVRFTEEDIKESLSPIRNLPAYPDVIPGLEKLKETDFLLIALSNGKTSVLEEQLDQAGISRYFDKILSVDPIRKYKPHPESYAYALRESGVGPHEAMMVAAHAWDTTGAMRAGLKTAFIQRRGKYLYPLAGQPDILTSTIENLAIKLIN